MKKKLTPLDIIDLKPSTLNTLIGKTNSAKSLWLQNVSVEAANSGQNVVYFSLEATEKKILKRIEHVRNTLGIDNAYVGRVNIKFFNAGEAIFKDFSEHLNALKESGFEPQLIVVDYITLMNTDGFEENYYLQSKNKAEQLVLLSKEFDLPVLTAAQSIDLVEHRIDGVTSWVENDSIMDSMNNIFSINRSEESTVRIKILKNSYGKVNKSYEFDLEGLAITNGTEI